LHNSSSKACAKVRLYPNKKKEVPAKTPNAKLHNMRYSTNAQKACHDRLIA